MTGSQVQPGGEDSSPAGPPSPPPGTIDERVAVNVRTLRERLGWSQADLAQKMKAAGWDSFYPQTIHRIESGQRKVSVGEGDALARLLGTALSRLGWPEGEDVAVAMAEGSIARIRIAWREASTAARDLASALSSGERALASAQASPYQRVRDLAGQIEAEIRESSVQSAFEDGEARWEQRDEEDGDRGPC